MRQGFVRVFKLLKTEISFPDLVGNEVSQLISFSSVQYTRHMCDEYLYVCVLNCFCVGFLITVVFGQISPYILISVKKQLIYNNSQNASACFVSLLQQKMCVSSEVRQECINVVQMTHSFQIAGLSRFVVHNTTVQ